MTEEKNHAKQRPGEQQPEPKEPSSLPGPNRFPDTTRYGEALAPGTIPEEERQERERRHPDEKQPGKGLDRP